MRAISFILRINIVIVVLILLVMELIELSRLITWLILLMLLLWAFIEFIFFPLYRVEYLSMKVMVHFHGKITWNDMREIKRKFPDVSFRKMSNRELWVVLYERKVRDFEKTINDVLSYLDRYGISQIY